jgi:hypothetical protein
MITVVGPKLQKVSRLLQQSLEKLDEDITQGYIVQQVGIDGRSTAYSQVFVKFASKSSQQC